MVTTADGRVTIGGRSGPIGNEADQDLFHALRTRVDAVMVGAGTLRAEKYGRLVRKPERREARERAGLAPDPLAVIVSGRLDLPPDLPLLHEPEQQVLVATFSDGELPGAAASSTCASTAAPSTSPACSPSCAGAACARSCARAGRR